MKILVSAASKHNSTYEIAEAIADELRRVGMKAEVFHAEKAPAPSGYDAAVLGSAIYMGSWMGEARDYVEKHQAQLAQMPVWLFSSGPLGAEDPQPSAPPQQLDELLEKTGARGHEIFVGKLDKDGLGFGEKLIVKGVKAPYGDFRDWDAIRGWARSIAAELEQVAA